MTPEELRAQLSGKGLSQRGAAKILQIDERTMRRYCSGDLLIPKVVAFAVYWITRAGFNASSA